MLEKLSNKFVVAALFWNIGTKFRWKILKKEESNYFLCEYRDLISITFLLSATYFNSDVKINF